METDFLASGNCFLLFRGLSFKWKLSLKLVEANLKKDYILTKLTDFLANENHFLPFFQTVVKMEENGRRKWKEMVSTSQKISFH